MFPSNDVINEPDFVIQKTGFFDQRLTKNDIPAIIDRMVESVLENGDPLEYAEKVKIMELIMEGFKGDKRYRDYALEELAKWGKDGYITQNGARVLPWVGGGKWDFTVCNDPILNDLEQKVADRKAFLKGVSPKGEEICDETTGELVTIFPPNKPNSTTSYSVSLKK